jgi:outer membrane lipopolysaccharide assembly protein LptE/RlpB
MNRHIARRLTTLMLALVLGACGFHLRGTADLAFTKLYIKGASSISKDLTSTLKTNGLRL